MAECSAVFVNGFDFGTSEDEIAAHMSTAGRVVSVEMKKGSAVVTYANAVSAKKAEASLNKSTIAGNSRFLDVWLDKKSLPAKAGMKRPFGGGHDGEGGSVKVMVRGFDFDTTEDQIFAHMSKAGQPEELHWVSKGSVNVIYSSAQEATDAIQHLHGTTIAGNSRFLDVIIGGDRAVDRKGGKGWGGGKGKSGGKGKGKGQKGGDHTDEDPAGGGRVFVRGFDFGTDDEQLERHMAKAGPLDCVHWVNKGNAVVVYKKKASALKAVSTLDNTTIPGNSRFINVTAR